MSCYQEIVFSAVADGLKAERPLAAVPLFDEIWRNALLAVFRQSLERMGGVILELPGSGDLLQSIRDKLGRAKVVGSMAPEIVGDRDLANVSSTAELADVQVVIARAALVVAETGSVLLSVGQSGANPLARFAGHLMVLLDPTDIVVNLHHAYRRIELTVIEAEIDGMLIHSARGVRSLSVLPMAKHARPQAQLSKPQLRSEIAQV